VAEAGDANGLLYTNSSTSTAIRKFASGFNERSASSGAPLITVYGLQITGTRSWQLLAILVIQVNDAAPQGCQHRLRAIIGLQLAENRADIIFDRPRRQKKRVSNLLIILTLGHQL